jgi:hypothetical protein
MAETFERDNYKINSVEKYVGKTDLATIICTKHHRFLRSKSKRDKVVSNNCTSW